MPINYTDTHGLFTKMGLLGGYLKEINLLQTLLTQEKHPVLHDAFTGNRRTRQITKYIEDIDKQIEALTGVVSKLLVPIAEEVLVDSVRDNDPLIAANTTSCLKELVLQMVHDQESVSGFNNSYSFTDTSGKNRVVVNTATPDGLLNQGIFTETLRLEVSADSYTGGTKAGSEKFSEFSVNTTSNRLKFDYTRGVSGAASFVRLDTEGASGKGNILSNSNFTLSTGTLGAPKGWEGTTAVLAGLWTASTSGLKMQGSELISEAYIQQKVVVAPLTHYAMHLTAWADTLAGSGTLTVYLCNANGNPVGDESGLVTFPEIALGSLTTTPLNIVGTFITPTSVPAPVYLRIKANPPSGSVIRLNNLAVTKMSSLYNKGPFVAVFGKASEPLILGERIDIQMVSTRSNNDNFQFLFERLLRASSRGYPLPYSGNPTINDTLIT